MKKIIVQEFNIDKMSIEDIVNVHNSVKSELSDDYILITTPFRTYMADPNEKLIYIDTKPYSPNELLEAIEKAEMYDGLCK